MQIQVKDLGMPLQQISDEVRKRAQKSATSEFRKIIVRETTPARKAVQAAARGSLPHAGGLNKRVAVLPRAIVHKTSTECAVLIRDSKKGMDLKRIDSGEVHHPLFGDRLHWYSQHVAPGFFTATLDRQRPIVQARVTAALINYEASINRMFGKETRL